MPGVFNSLITRGDASPLIPESVAAGVIQALPQGSAAMALFRRVNMGTKVETMPVLQAIGDAFWVNGDTGLKQTTEFSWADATLTAEEIAALVPIPDAVVADASIDMWTQIQPLLVSRIGAAIDKAVFSGTNKPPSWPTAIVPAAVTAGNVVTATSAPDAGGIVNDLYKTMDACEGDGYDVSGFALARSMRGRLRSARDTSGQRLLDASSNTIEGQPVSWVGAGVFDATTLAVSGDFTMAVLGVRQDITWKLLDQAVITDDTGAVILNLPQQDSQALRVVMRVAFAVGNPATPESSDPVTRYPFAALQTGP
jgi:HK97 family phage major capsid protein